MMRNLFVGALLAAGVGGCSSNLGAPPSDVVQAQVEYNLVVADDRAKFREQDLRYLGSVGPYAVYKITGANPRLVGPYVKAPTGFGYAMACGAAHYFAAHAGAQPAAIQLRGGLAGNTVLVNVPQLAQDDGGCTTPQDTSGSPIPDGGGGGGGCGDNGPPGGPGPGGATPGDGDTGDTGVQQIGL